MTNEEAIKLIKSAQAEVEWEYPMDYAAAFDMAIKALETPPDENWECYSKRLWRAAYERGKADAKAESEDKA